MLGLVKEVLCFPAKKVSFGKNFPNFFFTHGIVPPFRLHKEI